MIFRTKKGVRFIDYMLDMIENSIYKFIDVASETRNGSGIVRETKPLDLTNPDHDMDVPVNVPVNQRRILEILRENPSATAAQMAKQIGVTDKTIKRGLSALKASGLVVRVGSDKSGHWELRE